ncbi:homoserine kinase [Oceanospirillum linum]|uniref:Homoserine kinase n=1 Tax=Oceanospirillum linum TaxID=966 RepID=A0A1T1H816_OCELI|nr:homoserine kinase [Oceanospirillum linum]OOV85870.1 homoserine kinase [Oceanospirillum linum]SEG52951.1 homoserine kinase [Oleiphilus messinensis]SMP36038.1 homoserine kinase [Oceanospirillum linum]
MAVYTQVSETELNYFLQGYGLDSHYQLQGLMGGTENTTYRISYEAQPESYILTLFEQGDHSDLGYFVSLLTQLADSGMNTVAAPIVDQNGQYLQTLADKPALLFPCLSGTHPENPGIEQAKQLGNWLGQMHVTAQQFDLHKANNRSIGWMKSVAPDLLPLLDEMDQQLMQLEISHFADLLEECPDLPEGILHGDLFRDNTFYEGDTLTGVIDFYNGCNGHLLYDLAVVLNDWSCQDDSEPDLELQAALLEAYESVRPLTDTERHALPGFLRACALRYWISRLLAKHLAEEEGHPHGYKDPEHYKLILLNRIKQAGW